jgi:hypothetical protein
MHAEMTCNLSFGRLCFFLASSAFTYKAQLVQVIRKCRAYMPLFDTNMVSSLACISYLLSDLLLCLYLLSSLQTFNCVTYVFWGGGFLSRLPSDLLPEWLLTCHILYLDSLFPLSPTKVLKATYSCLQFDSYAKDLYELLSTLFVSTIFGISSSQLIMKALN